MQATIMRLVFGLLRHALQLAIGWVTAKGILSDDEVTSLLMGLAGAIVVGGTYAWGWLKARWQARRDRIEPRNFHGRADFMVVALALGGSLVLTGCASSRAFIAPAPDATDQAAIRSEVNRAVIGLNHGVLVLRDVGDALPTFGLPARDLNRIDCGIARVLGTSAPAPAPVVAVCGPIPLTADAPFGRALDELENVTSCAGLQSTLLAVGGHVGPVLDLLDQSTSTPLRILGASLRLTLAVTAPGGVQCH